MNLALTGHRPQRLGFNDDEMSADNLGIDIHSFTVSGFTVDKWIHDIQGRLDEIKRRETEKDLKADEKFLDSLLSEDKKTELLLKILLQDWGCKKIETICKLNKDDIKKIIAEYFKVDEEDVDVITEIITKEREIKHYPIATVKVDSCKKC